VAEIDDTTPPEDPNNVVPFDKQNHAKPPRKKFRKIVIRESVDGQYFYRAQGRNGEAIYTSETFTQRSDAVRAARREHEGRSEKFDYVLEYETARGTIVKETL
jgi:uncharacterized protein YegP (UPF0339 family)